MSSSYSYSLGAKVISEFCAMTLTIFLGESILANELLKSTKGHGMGILAVSIGFGLAFGVNIAWFGAISAHINPAMFFFLALIGKVSWAECFACGAADFAGAFLGGILVVVFYYPHFGFSLPLPCTDANAALVEGPASMEKDACRFASACGPASKKPAGETLRKEFRHALFSPADDHYLQQHLETIDEKEEEDAEMKKLLAKMEMRHKRRNRRKTGGYLTPSSLYLAKSNKTVQVAPLLHTQDLSSSMMLSEPSNQVSNLRNRHSVQVAGLLHTHDQPKKEEDANGGPNNNNNEKNQDEEDVVPAVKDGDNEDNELDKDMMDEYEKAVAEQQAVQDTAYKAAIRAEQSAVLSIFATRPAIFNRPYNFLQECLLSAALFLGVELFNLRMEKVEEFSGGEVVVSDGVYFRSFYVAMYIAMLILGLGGVTGLAANPARDLGPRFAHYVLPLQGKGVSEWNYGLVVPLWGPLAGSCVAAGIFKGMEALYGMAEIVVEE